MMVSLKLSQFLALVLPVLQVTVEATAVHRDISYERSLPHRTLAGVTIVDTPIVRDAQAFAQKHSSDFVYKHVMRSWLFGVLVINHNDTLRNSVDLEVHAVAALLHDLGWDQTPGSPFISQDKRFEIDGAIAARNFLKGNQYGKTWDAHRVQLVFDAIALHAEPSFANYKEFEVMTASQGILSEFSGPVLGVTSKEYAAVISAFPNNDMAKGFNDTMLWLCGSKAVTTYDTWIQPWGDNYIHNYQSKGNRFFDTAFLHLPSDQK
ncbi:hypothetical protein BGZ63DRAFT_513271 [Mariannaea sp. PMI_226]|nr:hypothetical protein BGZ63DRAFT_513271 [Mariannaea sp. PMI_226]